MSMTRQNYEALAATLGRAVAVEAIDDDATRAKLCKGAAYRVAEAVADCLADSSPRYNRTRFMLAVHEEAFRIAPKLRGDSLASLRGAA